MKQISLVLLGLGLASATAYAGAIETPLAVSNDINITAPDQTGLWSFGATAVLMRPIGGGFNYANSRSSATTDGNTSGSIDRNVVHPSYSWWFGADVSYAFPGNGRDVMLAYEGMHTSTKDSTDGNFLSSPFAYSANTAANNGNSVFANGSYTTNGGTFTSASGKAEVNYGAGDLIFGQKLDVGTRIRLHPFAGLRYAYIDHKNTGDYAGGSYTTYNVTENAKFDSTFNGIGPRFGSDAQANLGQGFSVRGRLGLSALIGARKTDSSFVDSYYDSSTGVLVATDAQSADTGTQMRVVPEIDGRLGVAYTHDSATSMGWGIEAGWQAENYFNSNRNVSGSTSDFALQGPYARLQLDVA
ncbi:MAG: Legionella pneumophila major outer membrane protein precursor [Gammaproteobacteria bacterium]|jgi:hypothetical protein|nr:Legionella pneumophila major outer membrane protein precursor [Gammaproteobacteria bacterium]